MEFFSLRATGSGGGGTVTPTAPSQIVRVSGNAQSGAPNVASANELVAEIRTSAGVSVPGSAATWAVFSGSATLSPSLDLSDTGGQVQTRVTPTGTAPIVVRCSLSANSSIYVDFSYTVAVPTAAAPSLIYDSVTQTLSISENTPGVTNYYTLDGGNPSTSSTPYTAALTGLTVGTQIRAVSGGALWLTSTEVSGFIAEVTGAWGPK